MERTPFRRSTRRRGRRLPILAALVSLCCAARADTVRYSLEIQDRIPVSYTLEIPVLHEGNLQVAADWDCSRILSFRLEGPGSSPVRLRRSGPSPQTIRIPVTRADLDTGKPFTLAITSLPAGGAGKGLITIQRPDSPQVIQERREAMKPPEPERPEPPWWMLPGSMPDDAGPELADLYARVERFRAMVVPAPGRVAPDPCRWQTELLEKVSEAREDLAEKETGPSSATARYYHRIGELVRRVGELRQSEDPFLAGPPPTERNALHRWLRSRRERIKPLEHELDVLMDMPEDGYVPELAGMEWPVRFVSCLMACERNFAERGRTGTEEAANQDLADAAWPFIRAAADALEGVANLVESARITLDRSPRIVDNQEPRRER